MILSAQTIRLLCRDTKDKWLSGINYPKPQDPMITPFFERGVAPNGKSYGLSSAGYDIRIGKFQRPGNHTRMMNGDFILAASLERIKMPRDITAFVKDKSSWAREGLAVQNTVLEPGWEGYITLELSFHRPAHHIVIGIGDPIAQLIFQRLDEPTEQPYTGKYQNQPDVPVDSIKEEAK